MMINVTELKRKVIDEFLISQPLVTNTPFKSVAKIYTGESTNAEEKNKYSVKTDDCYPYVSTKDISIKGSVNFENGMYIPKGEKKFSIAPVNSILLCIEGGNAGNKIAIIKEATCFVNKLCCFDIFGADNRFIYYYLLSNQFRNNFKEQMTGLIGGVSVKKLKELILPLPHITEQKRIADKLDEIFAELDRIDEKQTRLATIQEKMEAKILKLAIQGKLVEQRPEEGTGEELFKHIQLEKQELIKQGKIKKEKTPPAIEEDEVPFEIPSTWKWARLGELFFIGTGKTPLKGNREYYDGGDINWATSSLTGNRYISNTPTKITNIALVENNLRVYPAHTLIVAMYGEGKTRGQISELLIPSTINQACAAIEPILLDNTDLVKYVFYYFKFMYDDLREKAGGAQQPNLNMDIIKRFAIPLPPLKEQKRIVAKIEELLPLCRSN